MGENNTDKKGDQSKNIHEDFPTSRRKSEIDGKRFLVIRHFIGDKDLSSLLVGLAERRASREMGL